MKLFGKKQASIPTPTTSAAIAKLEKGTTSLADVIAPSSVEVDFNYIRVGDFFYKTLFVVGYPRFVSPNWLSSLIDFDHSMNISMFCYSTLSNDVLSDIRRKIAEMEATISSQAKHRLIKLDNRTLKYSLSDQNRLKKT